MLADDFNEDAATFLGRPVPSSLGTIEARVCGIQSVELVDDWIESALASAHYGEGKRLYYGSGGGGR